MFYAVKCCFNLLGLRSQVGLAPSAHSIPFLQGVLQLLAGLPPLVHNTIHRVGQHDDDDDDCDTILLSKILELNIKMNSSYNYNNIMIIIDQVKILKILKL